MKVLVIGSGGREHALSWKIAQSKSLTELFIAPGNAGTAEVGTNVDISVNDFEKLGNFCLEKSIDMVVVGPEDPLVKGIYDYFQNSEELKNIAFIGPEKQAAMLEGSKEYAKEFMQRYAIPTAKFISVTKDNLEEGIKFLDTMTAPYVLKADGLAAGKGVLILDDLEETKNQLKAMLDGKFGEASHKVVIEEHLKGIELSVFVLTDGENYLILPEAKDYKRIGEGDTGLNTGGMGAITPVPFADKEFMTKVEEQIVKPTIHGLKNEELKYKGFIFIGLMNSDGTPKVIEYNVRMGDPESEVVIPKIKSDLLEIFKHVANNTLNKVTLEIEPKTSVTVMLVSGGYPEDYEKGKVVTGTENVTGSIVFHAGTKLENGKVVTNGGRVISVTTLGDSMKEALAVSYKNVELIQFEKKNYRKDIGFDL